MSGVDCELGGEDGEAAAPEDSVAGVDGVDGVDGVADGSEDGAGEEADGSGGVDGADSPPQAASTIAAETAAIPAFTRVTRLAYPPGCGRNVTRGRFTLPRARAPQARRCRRPQEISVVFIPGDLIASLQQLTVDFDEIALSVSGLTRDAEGQREPRTIPPERFSQLPPGVQMGQHTELARREIADTVARIVEDLNHYTTGLTQFRGGVESADELSAEQLQIVTSEIGSVESDREGWDG